MPIGPQSAAGFPPAGPEPLPTRRAWHKRILGLVFVVFCFEIGVVLMVLPWLNSWDANLAASFPWLATLWPNTFFRGAVSGLGMVNIYISFLELLSLLRG